ncbi:acyl-[acyl-carrier-protein] thioesterase [Flavobacterium silvaticum]|uniref:Acyl-[acyl-carrier-protein] thioesterase n=1 Tax=Flavobacterium silvaticum TaxID=1852020 RepID=A0A972JIK0_9FLAO|nr:acyl-ACP thioesterase domain-containing protein [Flavobacterium silvaticum]NMH29115.1 acyl-[acyl-carrier-protein] thioesterase [Flavobacterium silvaticum]
MPISAEFTSVLETQHTINFTECYPNGFLRYTDLCNILQLAAGEHAEMGGISFSDMQEFDQAWVMSRMRIEIDRLPRWKDKVVVKTWIVNLENSRSVRALELYCNDKKFVGCETFWAVFNTKSRRPEALALPHEHFEKFNDRFSTEERVRRIELPVDMNSVGTKKVVMSDIDIVNHVNNVKYLEWCLDMEPSEIVLSGKIKALDMNFMSEVLIEEDVEINRSESERKITGCILRNQKPCFAVEIQI